MNTKQIIDEMEELFDEKLAELKCADYSTEEVVDFGFRYKIGDEIGKAVDWAHVKSFIHSYTRKLIESVAEEVIGEDEDEALDDFELNERRSKNLLRAEQRLKVKEIITNLK